LKEEFLNPRLFIVTGGPGAGKTTLLHELARRGFVCASEVAREIIQEQVQTGGRALPWLDTTAFTRLMLQRSIDSYLRYRDVEGPAFSDRGLPDTLCYARLIGLQDSFEIREACVRYRYAKLVFLAPPWEEIYHTDNERKQDFAEAARTYENMEEVYRECGYECLVLPEATPEKRAEFVIESVKRVSPGR
jgi:predicted ATPase